MHDGEAGFDGQERLLLEQLEREHSDKWDLAMGLLQADGREVSCLTAGLALQEVYRITDMSHVPEEWPLLWAQPQPFHPVIPEDVDLMPDHPEPPAGQLDLPLDLHTGAGEAIARARAALRRSAAEEARGWPQEPAPARSAGQQELDLGL